MDVDRGCERFYFENWNRSGWKAQAIVRRHLFCMTATCFADEDFFTSFGMCYILDLQVMAGHTTPVYTCRALENVAPQVKMDIFCQRHRLFDHFLLGFSNVEISF